LIATIFLRHRRNNERSTYLQRRQSTEGGSLVREDAIAQWNQFVRERKSRDRARREDKAIGLDEDEIPLSKHIFIFDTKHADQDIKSQAIRPPLLLLLLLSNL
jgi:hypothetical protein